MKSKIRYIVWEECKKVWTAPSFWITILCTAVICFTATLYVDMQGKNYSIAETVGMFSLEQMLAERKFSSISVASNGTTGYFITLSPMLVGIALIEMLCGERKYKTAYIAIQRTGRWKIIIGKFFSAVLCGGMVLTGGYILFILIVYGIFPRASLYEEPIESYQILSLHPWSIAGSMELGILSELVLSVFLFGVIITMLVYSLTIFFTNTYLVVCIPFLLLDLLRKFFNIMGKQEGLQGTIMEQVNLYGNPINALSVFQRENFVLQYLGVYTVVSVLLLFIHWKVMKGRWDCGT